MKNEYKPEKFITHEEIANSTPINEYIITKNLETYIYYEGLIKLEEGEWDFHDINGRFIEGFVIPHLFSDDIFEPGDCSFEEIIITEYTNLPDLNLKERKLINAEYHNFELKTYYLIKDVEHACLKSGIPFNIQRNPNEKNCHATSQFNQAQRNMSSEELGERKEQTYQKIIKALCEALGNENPQKFMKKEESKELSVGYSKPSGDTGIVGHLIKNKYSDLASSTLSEHIRNSLKL